MAIAATATAAAAAASRGLQHNRSSSSSTFGDTNKLRRVYGLQWQWQCLRNSCSIISASYASSPGENTAATNQITPAVTGDSGSSNQTPTAVSSTSSSSSGSGAGENEEYEVELERPYGIKFYKGVDGGTYIDALTPGASADKSKKIQPGDRLLATSAVFGNEIWPAAEYGRTMYTIRQRVGPIYMKLQKRYGKKEDVSASREVIAAQRNANVISDELREIQYQNAKRKKELEKKREVYMKEGLELYKKGDYEAALAKFDSVLGSKPDKVEEGVASYNVACCCAKLNQIEAGLRALEESLEAGFEDYKKVRSDPDLANLRGSDSFKKLIDKYDEAFIDQDTINAIKRFFGFFTGNK